MSNTNQEPTKPEELKDFAPVVELVKIQHARGLSDADFARVIKFAYTGSVWGKIRNGTHNGRVSKAVTAVRSALANLQASEALTAEGGIIKFDHVKDALAACEIAKASPDEHRLVIVAGVSGSGKTRTLKFLHDKFGGDYLNAETDWAHSFMSCVIDFAAGIGLTDEFKRIRKARAAIMADLKARPRLICIDEANYFCPDGLNLIKAICNSTQCWVAIGTLPNDLRRLNSVHNHETRQVIRRAVAIIALPMVDSDMVLALHKEKWPHVQLCDQLNNIVNAANKYHRLDTVVRIFEDVDPDVSGDIALAIKRVEKAIKVEDIK